MVSTVVIVYGRAAEDKYGKYSRWSGSWGIDGYISRCLFFSTGMEVITYSFLLFCASWSDAWPDTVDKQCRADHPKDILKSQDFILSENRVIDHIWGIRQRVPTNKSPIRCTKTCKRWRVWWIPAALTSINFSFGQEFSIQNLGWPSPQQLILL